MNDNKLYQYALYNLKPEIFENISRTYISNKFPSAGLRFPSDHSGGDGGEDTWDELSRIKYAFSIEKDWSGKLKEEIEKVGNSKTVKKVKKIRYITNQDISTLKINRFKKKNSELIANLKLEVKVYALNELTIWLEEYFNTTNDFELYDLLGISSLLVGERKLITFGLNDKDINYLNEEREQYQKDISYNKASQNPSKIVSNNVIFDLCNKHFTENQNYHYLISADAGMGKSYEMKKTVYLLHQKTKDENKKDFKNSPPVIQVYYYPLRTYRPTSNPPWHNVTPKHTQECFYVFLDGFDELSGNNQNNLLKQIEEEFRNRPQTFFVISARPLSFSYTTIGSLFDTQTIKANITIPNKNGYGEIPFEDIPFFRNLISKQDITYTEKRTKASLIKDAIENDYGKILYKNDKNPKSLEKKKFDTLLTYMGEFSNIKHNRQELFWNKDDLEEFLDEKGEQKRNYFIDSVEDSIHLTIDNNGNYSFAHNIYKEYLIAFYLLSQRNEKNEIPKDFLIGIDNQLIKSQYFNIYSLWLSLLSEESVKKEVYDKAINLALDRNNIQVLFLCDETLLTNEVITTTLEILLNDYEKYGFIMYQYRDKLGSFIKKINNNNNNDRNEKNYLNKLIDNIKSMISQNKIQYIDLPADLIEKILEVDKLSPNQKNELENLIKLLIEHINNAANSIDEYDHRSLYIFLLQDIVKIYDKDFNAYKKFGDEADASYKREFEIDQIINDFVLCYNYFEDKGDVNSAIEKQHGKLISIIWDLVSIDRNKSTVSSIPDAINDSYHHSRNHFKLNYFELYLEKFVNNKYRSTDDIELPIIPPALRNFILEALEHIISEIIENKSDVLSDPMYSNDILRHISNIFFRITKDIDTELTRIEEIFFKYNVVLQKILFLIDPLAIEKLLQNIISKVDDTDKIEWLKKSIDLESQYNNSFYPSEFINIILDETEDYDHLKNSIDILKKQYEDNQTLETIYKLALLHLKRKHKDKDKIESYIYKDYQSFWKESDEIEEKKNKRSKVLLNELKQVADDSIKDEVESLFNKKLFKKDAFKILEAFKENDLELYKHTYNFIVSDLNPTRYRQDGKQIPEKLPPYYNQLALLFLSREARDITQEKLTELVNRKEWTIWTFIIIISFCIDNDKSNSQAPMANTDMYIDFNKEYANYLLGEKKEEFDELFEELKSFEETNTVNSIILIINIWLKKNNKPSKQFDAEDIYNFIQCIGINGHLLLELNPDNNHNMYLHLEDMLDGKKELIIEACKKYITNNSGESLNKNSDSNFILRGVIQYLRHNTVDDKYDKIDDYIIKIYLSYPINNMVSNYAFDYIEERKLYKKLDEELSKQGIHKYIESLDSDAQSNFLYRIVLKNKDSLPETFKSLKELFDNTKNQSLKYHLAFISLDNHSNALKWLTDYFINDGDVKKQANSYLSTIYEHIKTDVAFKNDIDIENLIKLVRYSYEKEEIRDRRKYISELAFAYIYNSVTEGNFNYIKTSLNGLAKKNQDLSYKLNATPYLRDLEEKAFNSSK